MKSWCSVTLLLLAAVLCGTVPARAADAQAPADAGRGRGVFTAKHCARCHTPGGARGVGPALEKLRRPQGAYELAGRLWNHAPAMFTVLYHEGLEWPAISAAEMADLMAYLQADAKADPAPDLAKGRMTLISKGCLKCHSLRKEGGRAGPDLAERRDVYAPASRWAATMWSHTPRMATAAIRQEVLYPRFTGDEMVNLLGFLKAAPGAP